MHPPPPTTLCAVFKYSTKLTLLLDIILAAIRFPLKANSNRHIQVMSSFPPLLSLLPLCNDLFHIF